MSVLTLSCINKYSPGEEDLIPEAGSAILKLSNLRAGHFRHQFLNMQVRLFHKVVTKNPTFEVSRA